MALRDVSLVQPQRRQTMFRAKQTTTFANSLAGMFQTAAPAPALSAGPEGPSLNRRRRKRIRAGMFA